VLDAELRQGAADELERMLGLYHDKYADFTVKHFHEDVRYGPIKNCRIQRCSVISPSAVILDRIIHNAYRIELNGDSLRRRATRNSHQVPRREPVGAKLRIVRWSSEPRRINVDWHPVQFHAGGSVAVAGTAASATS
jgi:hypothetical protein